jgi:hypothetical protein
MYMTRAKTSPKKRMVRKQVYIYPRQEAQLKRVAESRDVTEAEVIREALEMVLSRPLTSGVSRDLSSSEEAWQKLLKSMEEHRAQSDVKGKPHRWTRADYYDDERHQWSWAK